MQKEKSSFSKAYQKSTKRHLKICRQWLSSCSVANVSNNPFSNVDKWKPKMSLEYKSGLKMRKKTSLKVSYIGTRKSNLTVCLKRQFNEYYLSQK